MEKPELRQNIVTKEWVLIAPGRAKRSSRKIVHASARRGVSKANCPLEDPFKASGKKAPLIQYGEGSAWRSVIIENKYPAVTHEDICPEPMAEGPYLHKEGVGRHEILITRDHVKNFADLSMEDANEVFMAFVERCRALEKDSCLEYVSIFQNWGKLAGGSQSHPHFQMIAVAALPSGVARSLSGAADYFKNRGRCAHCVIAEHEMKEKTRVIYQNKDALVFAPYASTNAFEFYVQPKKHLAHFCDTPASELSGVVEALRAGLGALKKGLHDPDYNLFIHTAPLKREAGDERMYHWHIEVFPKANDFAGFELGTGMVINPVSPEHAAQLLREVL